MRKLFCTILIASLFSIGSFSQESKGNFTVDMNFNPAAFFDAFAGPMFEIPYIKGRYFISSDMAVRLGFNLGAGGEKEYLDVDGDDYNKTSSFSWTIAPGIEKQFGSDKFIVYLGADIPFSSLSTKSKSEIAGTTIEGENLNGGYFSFGVNGVFGVDYYLFPNFYVGAEFTPGFMYTKYKDEKIDGTVTDKGGSENSFQLGSSSGIRIGVRF